MNLDCDKLIVVYSGRFVNGVHDDAKVKVINFGNVHFAERFGVVGSACDKVPRVKRRVGFIGILCGERVLKDFVLDSFAVIMLYANISAFGSTTHRLQIFGC